jgi:hypothetical protein
MNIARCILFDISRGFCGAILVRADILCPAVTTRRDLFVINLCNPFIAINFLQ